MLQVSLSIAALLLQIAESGAAEERAANRTADWSRGFTVAKSIEVTGRVVDIFLDRGRLHTASDDQGQVVLSVFDTIDPMEPKLVGRAAMGPGRLIPDSGYREFIEGAIFVRDGLAGIAQSEPNRLVLADVSDPRAPRAVSTFDAEPSKDWPKVPTFGNDVWITPEGIAILTTWGGVCHVLDVKDPARPRKIADIAPPMGKYGSGQMLVEKYASAVWIEGRTAYIVWWVHGRLVTIDLSDPSNPKKLGEIETARLWGGWAYRVLLSGRIAFLSADQYDTKVGGVHAIDVSDLTNPKQVGFFSAKEYASPAPAPRKWTRGLALDGNHLFVTDYAIGMICLDVSNPAAMKLTDQLTGMQDLRGLCAGAGVIYAAAGAKGLLVVVPK